MKLNKKIILASILMLIALLYTSTVHAAIQSSGGVQAAYYAPQWITLVRQMESVGGGFGLSETIKGDLTSSSGSNNIDVHMEKNTEYGAMAILSASSYGNPKKIANKQTTTGNETGIVISLEGYNSTVKGYDYELTASTFNQSDTLGKMNRKYRNGYYENNGAAKIGDATAETYQWHGSAARTFGRGNAGSINIAVLRGYYGKTIFDYLTYSTSDKNCATRCVVITGEGI